MSTENTHSGMHGNEGIGEFRFSLENSNAVYVTCISLKASMRVTLPENEECSILVLQTNDDLVLICVPKGTSVNVEADIIRIPTTEGMDAIANTQKILYGHMDEYIIARIEMNKDAEPSWLNVVHANMELVVTPEEYKPVEIL